MKNNPFRQSRHPLGRKAAAWALSLALAVQAVPMVSAQDSVENHAPTAPTGLLMDLMEKPLGIDSAQPAMSWIVNDPDNNEVQTAYQILVASTCENIDADTGDVWDSGKVDSSESSNALYNGPALQPESTYYWKVRTWDKDGAVGPYSEPQKFTTAVETWSAEAIWAGEPQGTQVDNVFTRNGWTDYDLECDFAVTDVALGISFRTDNSESNCYMWQFRSDKDTLVPHVFTNNSPSASAAVPLNTSLGSGKHHLKISVQDNTVTTYLDGQEVDSRELSNYAYGSIGFRTGNSESGWVDNVTLKTPDGKVLYENDFSENADGFSAGTVQDGKLVIGKGTKAYYVLDDGQEDPPAPRGNVFFTRKDFTVPDGQTVESAVVSVAAKMSGFKGSGSQVTRQYIYRMYVNGEFVGLGPHFDSYDGMYFYNTFDVTEQVTDGENTIGALCYVLQDQRFQAQLKVTYTDGSFDIIGTDETWKTMDATEVFGEGEASIGTGYYTAMAENIDARIYPYGWSEPDFNDSEWLTPEIKEQITGIYPSAVDPVLEHEVEPAQVVDKGDGNFFIDLGAEIIGGLRLTIDGVDGTVLTVLSGEELSGTNTVRWQMRTGNNYREYWTLKDGVQTIENFGMKNFRYVEIQGCPEGITAEDLQAGLRGVALHQRFDESESYFESDNEILNDVYDFTKYSLMVTTQDLYVDSQSRERGPYEGDAYINQLSHYSFARNYNVSRFTNEFMAYHPEWCTEYRLMNIMSFWQDYLYTGNAEAIENNYDRLTENAMYNKYDADKMLVNSTNQGGGFRDLVDWPSGERDGYIVNGSSSDTKNPYNTVINAFNYASAVDLANMAELLDNSADAEKYSTFAENLKTGINTNLYDASTGLMYQGMTNDGTLLSSAPQHATFFPMSLGVIDDPEKLAFMADSLEQDGIKCSVYATQFLLTALYNAGDGQAALDMMTGTGTRSWAHLIYDLGATVASEAWDPSLKSNMTFSHAWGSAPGNVIVRDLCGIQPVEAAYAKARIKPQIGDLETVSVKVPNIKGYIEMSLDTTNPEYVSDMTVKLPANTTAKVYVPAEGAVTDLLLVDGQLVQAQWEDTYLVVDNVGSGTHTFQVPMVAKLTVSAEEGANFTGHTKQIELQVTDSEGQELSLDGAELAFVSSDVTVASVSKSGLVVFNAPGTAEVAVTVTLPNTEILGQPVSQLILNGTISFTVQNAQLSALEVSARKLEEPGQYQLTTYAVYDDGARTFISNDRVQYTSSDDAAATVTDGGIVTVLEQKPFTITAQVESLGQEITGALPAENLGSRTPALYDNEFENADDFPGASAADGVLTVDKGKKVFYSGGTDWSDYMVEASLKAVSNAASLTFYQTDANTFYLWQFNEKEGNVLKTHVFRSGLPGSYQLLDTVPLGDAYQPGQFNDVRIVCQDGLITTYVNGVMVYEIRENTLTQGSVGFRNGSSEVAACEYLRVSTPVVQDELAYSQVTVENGQGSGVYAVGETVTIQANDAPAGETFDHWVAEGVELANPSAAATTFTMPQNSVTIRAEYRDIPSSPSYSITVTQSHGGQITPGVAAVPEGASRTFTITADSGYVIADVLVDGKSVGAVTSYTFRNVTSRHTITAIFKAVSDGVSGFTDVSDSDWYAESVAYVMEKGLMTGTSATTFAPNSVTTRAMVVTILARMDGVDTSTGSTWYAVGRQWAMEEGISDGTNMEKSITREQLAAMLYRYAGSPAVSGAITGFVDTDSISDWAEDAMLWAVQNGILTGSGNNLNPQGNATRAQVAAMLMRFMEKTV